MQKYLIIGLLLISFRFTAQTKVDNARFKELMKDSSAVILDVRTSQEFEEGKISGAININYFSDAFVANVKNAIPKDRIVLVYCAAGGRSAEACKLLKKEGYKKLYDLSGGYNGWE